MTVMTGSFEWNGAKITVQKPNGYSQLRIWRLQQSLKSLEGAAWSDAASLCQYLANTVATEGTLPFPIPYNSPTPEEVVTFCRNLGEADNKLLLRWDNAIQDLMSATNDPDLLPPQELDEKKSATPA